MKYCPTCARYVTAVVCDTHGMSCVACGAQVREPSPAPHDTTHGPMVVRRMGPGAHKLLKKDWCPPPGDIPTNEWVDDVTTAPEGVDVLAWWTFWHRPGFKSHWAKAQRRGDKWYVSDIRITSAPVCYMRPQPPGVHNG